MRQKDLVLGTLCFSVNAVHAHLWSRIKTNVSILEKKDKNKNIGKRDGEREKFIIKLKNTANQKTVRVLIAYQNILISS